MAISKTVVVANLPAKVSEVIEVCRVVEKELTGNTYFPALPVPLTEFVKDIDALVEAEVNVRFSRDGAAVRDAALQEVLSDVRRYVNYVQLIADNNPDTAELIVKSSGFYIKKSGSGVRERGYDVESLTTGIVILAAPSNNHHYPYVWEISENAIDWNYLATSRLSVAECDTLTQGQLYYFRYRVIGEDNKPSMPSDSLSCRVK